MIEEKGGGLFTPPKNLLNLGALEYILVNIIDTEWDASNHLFLKEKAASLGYHIISRHVFNDGNKRTASHIVWEFLQANGVQVFLDETIIDLTLSIAEGTASSEDLYSWLTNHQES
jgi:death-on-curing protein